MAPFSSPATPFDIDPDDLLKAYSLGYFPMGRRADRPEIVWVLPDYRGVLELDRAHASRKLRALIAREPFAVRVDTAFAAVMDGCAEATPERPGTWINAPIRKVYGALHQAGRAHSVECWEGDDLVGGLYGVSLGGIFCGESMFSRRDNASKIAFIYLVAILKRGGFSLLDTQFHTEHLAQFGVEEIPAAAYERRLGALRSQSAVFSADYLPAAAVLQSITQTS